MTVPHGEDSTSTGSASSGSQVHHAQNTPQGVRRVDPNGVAVALRNERRRTSVPSSFAPPGFSASPTSQHQLPQPLLTVTE